MMTIATWTWKQTLVWICLIIWIATFMLGRSLDASNEFKTPQPYVNSLGVPIHIYEDPKLEKSSELDEIIRKKQIRIHDDTKTTNIQKNEKSAPADRLEEKKEIFTNLTKKILYFTSYFHMKDFQFGFGQKPFFEKGCPVTNCFATNNKTLLSSVNEFDAILFHIRDMRDGRIPLPNQHRRKSNQHYVMFLMESPLNDGFHYEKFKNFFNWTMTFRRDSDFYRPYGWIAPKEWKWHYPPVEPVNWKQYMTSSDATKIELKPKKYQKAAWLVSNCHTHSEREHYVEELQKYFPVEIYGECGSHKCPDNDNCHEYLAENYMFYLSFENSICKDYVTEKFFTPMNFNVLPVVLGGSDYSKIAPPKSHINTKDFSSPKDLAIYLKYLVKNQTAYHEYFSWKSYFKVYKTQEEYLSRAMCQLCEKLNSEDDKIPNQKIYENINDWWRTKATCRTKGSFSWSKPDDMFSGVKNLFSGVVKQTADMIETLRDARVIV